MTDQPDNRLGDAPIEDRYVRRMQHLARYLDDVLNPGTGDRAAGFVLLVFPYGEREGRCNYISNGADRADIVKMLREQAQRFEDQMTTEGGA